MIGGNVSTTCRATISERRSASQFSRFLLQAVVALGEVLQVRPDESDLRPKTHVNFPKKRGNQLSQGRLRKARAGMLRKAQVATRIERANQVTHSLHLRNSLL